jgi:hypothetical protein
MASLVVAIGAAIYLSVAKVHERKEKKRVLGNEQISTRGLVRVLSTMEDTTSHKIGQSPAYHKERLPAYHEKDQHPALRTDKRSVRHFGFRS